MGEVLRVGAPYPNPRLVCPETVAFHPTHNLLLACYTDPTPAELASFQAPWVEFALVPMGALVIILTRFPDQNWNDSAWANVDIFDPPELDEPTSLNERYVVTVCLVDARTGLVAHLRMFTLSPHFSRVYRREVLNRLEEPQLPVDLFLALVAGYQAAFPTKDLVNQATVRCKAGLK